MKGNAKCINCGGLGWGSSRVTGNVTIRQSAYDFIFDFNRNYASILHRYRVIASYLSKVAYFNLPHLHLAPPLGTPFEFREDFCRQKNESPCTIVWSCLRDRKFLYRFSRFCSTNTQTHRAQTKHATCDLSTSSPHLCVQCVRCALIVNQSINQSIFISGSEPIEQIVN